MEEEYIKTKAVQMGKQGSWTRWTTPERSLSWADIWQYEPLRLKFLLRYVYDVLPSPANLCQWNLTDNPNCRLCEKRSTLDHILSSCKVALSQGRYRWGHDTVLRELAHILELERKKKHPKGNTGIIFIPFVEEGTTNMPTSNAKKQGIIEQASDWTLQAGLDQKLQFPDIVQTSLRPDIVIQSTATKRLVIEELTVPWEERCQSAYELNKAKYTDLQTLCKDRGWQTWLFQVEGAVEAFQHTRCGQH